MSHPRETVRRVGQLGSGSSPRCRPVAARAGVIAARARAICARAGVIAARGPIGIVTGPRRCEAIGRTTPTRLRRGWARPPRLRLRHAGPVVGHGVAYDGDAPRPMVEPAVMSAAQQRSVVGGETSALGVGVWPWATSHQAAGASHPGQVHPPSRTRSARHNPAGTVRTVSDTSMGVRSASRSCPVLRRRLRTSQRSGAQLLEAIRRPLLRGAVLAGRIGQPDQRAPRAWPPTASAAGPRRPLVAPPAEPPRGPVVVRSRECGPPASPTNRRAAPSGARAGAAVRPGDLGARRPRGRPHRAR